MVQVSFFLLLTCFFFLGQIVVAQSAGPLPLLIDQSICAVPPGLVPSDGCRYDVCLLTICCSDWTNGLGISTLQSGSTVPCSRVTCPNVCRMACDRTSIGGEPCDDVCASSVTLEAYVFIHANGATLPPITINGVTYNIPIPFGHTGFGFMVAPHLYMYGALENPHGQKTITPGADTGFWLRNGSFTDMMCAFEHPPIISAPKYDPRYKKFSTPATPNVCGAVSLAESIYGSGYSGIPLFGPYGNSLDATYNVLSAYGVTDMPKPATILNGIVDVLELKPALIQAIINVVGDISTIIPNLWYDRLGIDPIDVITNGLISSGILPSDRVLWAESPFPTNLTCPSTPPTVTCSSAIATSSTCSPNTTTTPGGICISGGGAIAVTAAGSCTSPDTSAFQGVTSSCPCITLDCNCGPNGSGSGLPICDQSRPNPATIDSGSGCGTCDCTGLTGSDPSDFCLYDCFLRLPPTPSPNVMD